MKAIIDRAKSFTAIREASRRWSRSTARALAEFLRPELAPGEELPDLVLLQQLFARALARRWRRLSAADEAHIKARERRRERLAELDRKVRALYRQVAGLRSVLSGIFGAAGARHLISFSGATSRDAVVLLRQANRLAARLRDRSRPLPAALFPPSERQRDRWAGSLEAAACDLQDAKDRASVAGQELEAAKVERRRAVEDFNLCFVGVAGWLAGTYHAAGHGERAKAVRPSRRRQGLRLEDASRAGRTAAAPAAASTENAAEVESKAAAPAVEPKRSGLRFAPVRQAWRLIRGRSSGDEPPPAAAAGGS